MTTFIESNDIFGDATTILGLELGDRLFGAVNNPEEVDWLSVSLVAGQSYLMTLSGLNFPGGLNDPLLQLFDSNSVSVAIDDDDGAGLESVLTFEATTTGTFFIQAGGFDFDFGAYELTFDILQETTDAPDTAMTPFTVAPGEVFNGTFGADDDLDRVAVEMVAGETYLVSLEAFGDNDPGLRLFGTNGALLAQNNNFFGSNDSFISFTATTTGTHYLQALSLNGLGAYQLHVGSTSIEGPDAPQSAATPYAISADGFFSGSFDSASDHDIVAANVTTGLSYFAVIQALDSFDQTVSASLDVLDQASSDISDATETVAGFEIVLFTGTSTGGVFFDIGGDPFSEGATYEMFMGQAGAATIGTTQDDILVGNVAANAINLGAGDDLYLGFGGNDTLDGAGGSDTLIGGSGFDVLRGGGGDDSLEGGANADNLIGGAGNDSLDGGAGFDRIFGGTGDDFITAGNGSDGVFGQQGNDRIFGGTGGDRINGGPGNDTIFGEDGNDLLFGGAGFDLIFGDAGDDTMSGNFNADTFAFDDFFGLGNDTITDFAATNDFERIDLAAVAEITDLADLFANHLAQVGSDAVITIDASNSITLQGVNIAQLDANDFVF